jgi:PhoPQ-activated pathogenicity-related protein
MHRTSLAEPIVRLHQYSLVKTQEEDGIGSIELANFSIFFWRCTSLATPPSWQHTRRLTNPHIQLFNHRYILVARNKKRISRNGSQSSTSTLRRW